MDYIAYLRVSTKRQGESGLGLEAQREQVQTYVQSKGGTIIKEYVEIKSGTSRKRKLIKEAVQLSRDHKATLIVAKLDRLARDAEYAHYILNTAHDIVAVDIPEMNKMIFGIFSLMAEYERDLISKRTKDALRAKRATGWKPNHVRHNVGYEGGAIARWEDKEEYSYSVISTIQALRTQGMSLRAVADKLNQEKELTASGGRWNAMSVKRVLDSVAEGEKG